MKKSCVCFLFLMGTCLSLHSNVIHEKVVILGVCRNVEEPLPKTMEIIENLGGFFEDYRVIVYEENSKDRTPILLKEWQQKNPKVTVRSEIVDDAMFAKTCVNRELSGLFFRPERIARARNIVLEMALSEEFKDFPYLICIDMDFKKPPILEEGLRETFETDLKWDAVFAYGICPNGEYFDWYALRDKNHPIGPELLGRYWWHLPKRLVLKWKHSWYPVISAFSGLAIYRKESVRHARYSALVTKDLESVAKTIIRDYGMHPDVVTYLDMTHDIHNITYIPFPHPQLPRIEDPRTGVVLNQHPDPLIWRVDIEVCQYPVTCEHVLLHAAMIAQGYDGLYINPRLIMRY